MISIIICSRKADIPEELKQNIAETIGCEYELCVIDNLRNEYNIFTAYNEGVRRANGDVLCFMHEDVLFHTEGWGKIIINQLADKSIGIIGFAGTHFMPSCPLYWWHSPYISQYNLQTDKGITIQNNTVDYFHGQLADVAAVDGLCFFIPRRLFADIRFDATTYSGFHAYDMDICMQVITSGLRVCVSRSILVEHFWSEEAIRNEKYAKMLYVNMQLFYNKWKDKLPICVGVEEPAYVMHRLNNLCIQAYDAQRVRYSKAYRLGRMLLHPIKTIGKH